jgi:hypothetical protein
MKNSETSSQARVVIYRFILPACTIISLLIISQIMKRTLFLGSPGWDLFARIWIGFSFCYLYILLSDLDKYMFRVYRIKTDPSNDHNVPVNWQNFIFGSMLGIISIPFTWWIVEFFLPIFSAVGWLIALCNGVLLSIPIILRRSKFVP